MQVDVSFEFAKVYNVDKQIDVVRGEAFKLTTDLTGKTKWFSDQDQVLSLKQSDKEGENGDEVGAEIKAEALGTSTILIMNENFGIIKELTVVVVDAINPMAVSLQAQAGAAIQK